MAEAVENPLIMRHRDDGGLLFVGDAAQQKALTAVVQEPMSRASRRAMDDLVQAMGMSGVSKSCAEIDDKAEVGMR